MMTSLFSSFDPASNNLQMNWMFMFSTMMIMPMNFWMKKSRMIFLKKILEKKLTNDLWNSTNNKEMLIFSTSLFMMILSMNILSIFPYTYTPTAQMSISMSMALPMWLMLMIFGWTIHTNFMFKHLLPSGTPSMLMPMMIIIETVGSLIRPISLSVRLTANLIAGHLMMTLLGNINSTNTIMMILPIQTMLMMFESTISMIQAYVFTTLVTLYSSEIP
uniref:ATP synthase subunit a n=1 Tax=Sivaloka damnosus TaxID=568780 RepID=D8KZG6_SIVDA|nr:ATP synthase F0 subunit 6 [Sivaloka damnosus]